MLDVDNWYDRYLLVNGNLYSTKRNVYIAENDAAYLAFLADGQQVLTYATDVQTARVLANYGIAYTPTPELLNAYLTPTQITMRQARLILLQNNLLDSVNAIVSTLPKSYQIEWEYAQYADRSNPLISMVATAAGMTDAQIDTMFREASIL
jgi:type IV secretory pathway TrbF-like protein